MSEYMNENLEGCSPTPASSVKFGKYSSTQNYKNLTFDYSFLQVSIVVHVLQLICILVQFLKFPSLFC